MPMYKLVCTFVEAKEGCCMSCVLSLHLTLSLTGQRLVPVSCGVRLVASSPPVCTMCTTAPQGHNLLFHPGDSIRILDFIGVLQALIQGAISPGPHPCTEPFNFQLSTLPDTPSIYPSIHPLIHCELIRNLKSVQYSPWTTSISMLKRQILTPLQIYRYQKNLLIEPSTLLGPAGDVGSC